MLNRLAAVLVLVSALSVPLVASAQAPANPPQTNPARLRVFLDCGGCFEDYLRNEIKWADFVRQPQDADVHVLSTSNDTGGGGQELLLRLVGVGKYQGIDQALRVLSLPADAEDSRRRNVLRTLTVGLIGYMAREGLPPEVAVSIRQATERSAAAARDRWNAWVFGVNGDVSFQAEESNRETNFELGASADRVTNQWKISVGASLDHQRERFNLDEDEPFTVTRRERRGDGTVIRSLGNHWSFGMAGSVESSTFSNVKFSADAKPAIEFNVFPYSQYATRQLRLQYAVGVQRASYNEVTLFGKLQETLGQHEWGVVLDQRQPWGTLQAQAEWSQYLHDLGKYRFEVNGELSLRIIRGLSVNLEISASRIRDQISLPRRNATPEEVLLRLRELRSGYEVDFQFGLRYTFGSIFNNVVNPRFGG